MFALAKRFWRSVADGEQGFDFVRHIASLPQLQHRLSV